MSNYWEFVIFSMLLRIIEGIGSAGYITASFTIATILYPENTGTVIVRTTDHYYITNNDCSLLSIL